MKKKSPWELAQEAVCEWLIEEAKARAPWADEDEVIDAVAEMLDLEGELGELLRPIAERLTGYTQPITGEPNFQKVQD